MFGLIENQNKGLENLGESSREGEVISMSTKHKVGKNNTMSIEYSKGSSSVRSSKFLNEASEQIIVK